MTDSTYASNRAVAILADEIGLSFALTVARWKGIPGESVGYACHGIGTFTLAAAILEATKRITVISTAHTIVWNPAIAAKIGADLDQIGRGRWGLNVVAGWSEEEFGSLGLPLLPHDKRYEQAGHWIRAVKELWLEGESSYSCEFFTLDKAECRPRPLQKGGPMIVNAGQSPTGMKFAIDNCDYLLSAAANSDQFRFVRDELHSDVGYIGNKRLILGRTDLDAEEKANRIIAGSDLLALARRRGRFDDDGTPLPEDVARQRLIDRPDVLRKIVVGDGIVGGPETVAQELADWISSTSIEGLCLALCDFEETLEILADKVLEPLGNALAARGISLLLES
jgi:pyrimidine oxygenase